MAPVTPHARPDAHPPFAAIPTLIAGAPRVDDPNFRPTAMGVRLVGPGFNQSGRHGVAAPEGGTP